MNRTVRVALAAGLMCAPAAMVRADDGKAGGPPPQAKEAKAFHRAGQTFITWKEVEPLITADTTTYGEIKARLADDKSGLRYRIYCSDKPIAAGSLAQAQLLAEVGPLSACNVNARNPEYLRGQAMIKPDAIGELAADNNHYAQKWTMDSPRMDRFPVKRFVIDEKAGALPPDAGLYVHNPTAAGKRYYAVVSCRNGAANEKDFAGNTAGPVEETVGAGEPVGQGEGQWGPFFDEPGRRTYYVQWCAPPLAPRPNMYFNWSVLIPPKVEGKVPVELYFHGALGSYAQPNNKMLRNSIQIAPHDWPVSDWYGFNENYGTDKPLDKGVVRNHTQRRIIAFMEWAKAKFPIDEDRIIATGADGAACLVANYPEMFAYAFIAFDAGGKSAILNPASEGAYAAIWGPKSADIKDDQGRGEWGWAMLDKVVAAQVGKDLPLFMCNGASWGKIGGYGKGRGLFYNAMEDAREPLVAFWGWNTVPPPDRYTGLWRGMDIRRTTPIPAITHCSSDTDRESDGNYDFAVTWKDAIETADSLEMTILAAKGQTFDWTPRRCRKFKPTAGETLKWTATCPAGAKSGTAPQSGEVKADANGLVTIPGIVLDGGSVTVKIEKSK